MVGILQEQHPDRARLFMQWKGLNWPLMVDSLDLLEVPYVPITLAIDEYGIVRMINMRVQQAAGIEQAFLDQAYERPEHPPEFETEVPDISRLKAEAIKSGTAAAWRDYAGELVLWGGVRRLDEAVEAYESSIAVEPGDGNTHFQLGVALRARYDSSTRRPGDFQQAVQEWSAALEIDPNNYIWRRRIQQYGPRLGKPYSFYDWVNQARDEIRARGEVPLPLGVEPGGAELAYPARSFESGGAELEAPDPQGKIHRDKGSFIQVETTVVPGAVSAGGSARVHVVFKPNPAKKAHWNNEAGELTLWLAPPDGWEVDSRRLTVPLPPQRVSLEPRKVEFEVRAREVAAGKATLPAYALYYVCEDVKGACLYRRQDIPIELVVKK